MQTITKQQARQFILIKQGLLGSYRFVGKEGAFEYVRQAGCIQFGRGRFTLLRTSASTATTLFLFSTETDLWGASRLCRTERKMYFM